MDDSQHDLFRNTRLRGREWGSATSPGGQRCAALDQRSRGLAARWALPWKWEAKP